MTALSSTTSTVCLHELTMSLMVPRSRSATCRRVCTPASQHALTSPPPPTAEVAWGILSWAQVRAQAGPQLSNLGARAGRRSNRRGPPPLHWHVPVESSGVCEVAVGQQDKCASQRASPARSCCSKRGPGRRRWTPGPGPCPRSACAQGHVHVLPSPSCCIRPCPVALGRAGSSGASTQFVKERKKKRKGTPVGVVEEGWAVHLPTRRPHSRAQA